MTTLRHDHSAGARAISVPCLECGRMTRLTECVIDVDGPAFKAYYCREHRPAGTQYCGAGYDGTVCPIPFGIVLRRVG